MPDLTTSQKGAIAEARIAAAAIELGVDVYRPVGEGTRCDLVFDLGGPLVRVQCKWAVRRGEVITIPCYSARRTAGGLVRRFYRLDEIDAFAGYCSAIDRCFLLWMTEFGDHTQVQLRLTAPRNNQRARINWANEFDFAATLRRQPLGP